MRVNIQVTGFAILSLFLTCSAQEFHPDIPRAWDDKAVASLEVPLAQRDRSPRYMSAEEYYKLKARPIYRSYPVYVNGREPEGYLEALKQKAPEIIFDPSQLHSKEEWIAAGKLVFESDTQFFPARARTADDIRYPASTISKDGVLPAFAARYYIREKGVLELGINACSVPYTCDAGRLSLGGRAGHSHCATSRNHQGKTGEPRATAGPIEQFLDRIWSAVGHEP